MPGGVVLNTAEINEVLSGPNGPVTRDLLRRALNVERKAKRLAKANHGRLRGSITHQLVQTTSYGHSVTGVRVGTNVVYALWVHQGTGVYGPHHSRIRPIHAPVLRFTWHGKVMFRPSVSGQEANHYLLDALDAAKT
jgi:hypothetical protein